MNVGYQLFIRKLFKLLLFEELLEKNNSVPIRNRNLQSLAVKMRKIRQHHVPELFVPYNGHLYNLRHLRQCKRSSVNTVYFGTEHVAF